MSDSTVPSSSQVSKGFARIAEEVTSLQKTVNSLNASGYLIGCAELRPAEELLAFYEVDPGSITLEEVLQVREGLASLK